MQKPSLRQDVVDATGEPTFRKVRNQYNYNKVWSLNWLNLWHYLTVLNFLHFNHFDTFDMKQIITIHNQQSDIHKPRLTKHLKRQWCNEKRNERKAFIGGFLGRRVGDGLAP